LSFRKAPFAAPSLTVFCFYICFFREPALHEMLILIKRCCAAEKRSWKIKSGIKAMGKMTKKIKIG